MPLIRQAIPAAVLVAVTLVAGVGCKKKPPAPPPPPPPTVEVRLQVASINPAAVNPDQSTSGKIYGSAFVNGATVNFSGPTAQAGQEVVVAGSNTINLTIPALPLGNYDVTVTNPDGESATLRSGLTVKVLDLACKHATVNFAFDVHALNSSSRSILDGHMGCYQSITGSVKVEGHADERGTVDYNLALGQRRANSVKSHLTSGGVSGSRIDTVSYGEERPVASGHNESAWAKNRRAEINASN